MKYALIGCGRIAINHLYAVKNTGLDLVAVCDLIPEKMDQILEKAEMSKDACEKYTDYQKMLEDHPEIELVSIATESGKHAKIALYCIGKGIHVSVVADGVLLACRLSVSPHQGVQIGLE